RPQRPGPGLPARYGAGGGLQPHRALQPRHAPGVHRHRRTGRGEDGTGRHHRLLPGRHAVRGAEGAGDGAHRGGGEDPPRTVRRRAGLPRLRRQRRLRDRHPHGVDPQRHRLRAVRRRGRGRLQRSLRVQRGRQQGPRGPARDRRRRDPVGTVIRVGQVLLVLAAVGLWVASRMTWVQVTTFDGLTHPKTTPVDGVTWSTALVPLALLSLAAAVAALAVRGWALRLLALLVALAGAGMAYLGISLWVVPDVAVRAVHLVELSVIDLVDSQRLYGGAVVTVASAVGALVAAVLLMRAAAKPASGAAKYAAPAARRAAARRDSSDSAMSERTMWDALDEGRDPTDPDSMGR